MKFGHPKIHCPGLQPTEVRRVKGEGSCIAHTFTPVPRVPPPPWLLVLTLSKTETNLQQLCHDAADCIPDRGVSYYIVIPNLTVDNTIMSSTGALTVAREAGNPSELVYVNGS